ncbi:MAG TPA: FAD-dependent monooxygenase [Acidimicrobiales bacterium]|nr:FAD-dependent monooxygenase [Acidimicrobiales bacterium]
MEHTADVVIVGGGIAGGALGTVLARNGVDVVVLERQTTYRDKVRGEVVLPWGAVELLALGLEDVLLGAGGGYAERTIAYDETVEPAAAEAAPIPYAFLVPGAPGALNVGHPQACQALTESAAAAGARVVRGIDDVVVTAGGSPAVAYTHDGEEHRVACRLVVGADGRGSVVRDQVGITLEASEPRTIGAGLLVEGTSWPTDSNVLGTEDDKLFLAFPRPGGVTRLYLLYDVAEKQRFTGPTRAQDFLDDFMVRCIPDVERFRGTPIGPCSSYPMNDTWCTAPYAAGVVLVGDAAGWNDPIIGQGLSISLRDVRIVSEAILDGTDWSASAFAPYGDERSERMRRLRFSASITTDLRCDFTERGRTRRAAFLSAAKEDFSLLGPLLAGLMGPDKIAPDAFSDETRERILAFG